MKVPPLHRWFAVCLVCVVPASAADSFDSVRAFIRRELTENSIPSVAVAVVHNGRIEWEEGFGWADREQRRPATEHTMYSLASISKPITATGLMTLVRAGKIDLDRPMNDYLGSAKLNGRAGEASGATVRRVANHSAGLPLHYQFFYADEPYRRPPMDETILRYGNLVTAPGERYQYSNLGYGIIDYAIARVSGESYVAFMRRAVFEPLGLTHMSVDIGPGLEEFTATRYGRDGKPIPFYDFDHPGASAIFSSAHDLARFALFHLKAHLPDQKAILTDELIDEMHKSTQSTGGDSGYGVGFGSGKIPGGYRVVSHTGGMGGVSTVLRLYPDEKLAVIALCNASTSLPARVADEVQKLKLPNFKPPASTPPRPRRDFTPPADLVGTWSGKLHTYAGERPLKLWVLPSGDVHAQIGQQFKMLVNNVALNNGILTGDIPGEVPTDDARRNHSHVALSLKLRGDVLNGAVIALGRSEPRVGNALSHWAELRREPTTPAATAAGGSN